MGGHKAKEKRRSRCCASPYGFDFGQTPSAQDDKETKAIAQRKMMYYVYILTNKTDAVMYIGVTNDLRRRLYEHKKEQIEGFTKKYHVHKLVYFEEFSDVNYAIAREKQLKGWTRDKKSSLVESKNPNWNDWGENYF